MKATAGLLFLNITPRAEIGVSSGIVKSLIRKLRIKYDPYFLNDHPMRVAELADDIALVRGYSTSWRRSLAITALLHDIGKVHPECKHLFTAGSMPYDAEFRKMVTAIHQEKGPLVLAGIDLGQFEVCRPKALVVCARHHDPANTVPRLSPETCIVAVADAWDALTSNVPGENERGYRAPYTTNEARRILIEEMVSGKFDPHVVVALLNGVLSLTIPSIRHHKKTSAFHQESFVWT